MTTRGIVLGLTLPQVAERAKRLGDPANVTGFYLLKEHNGGKDPTAPDPFDRWTFQDHDGNDHTAATADCIGGALWNTGADRYQPVRFPYYDGWINTDSMLDDVFGKRQCFVPLDYPEPGCFAVARTGAPGFRLCGHIITAHTVPPDFEIDRLDSWKALMGCDVASMGYAKRANTTHDLTWWYAARHTAGGFAFCKSIMVAS